MECIVPNRNIKVFGKAVQCAGKIGEEIYFEGDAEGLSVRAVNLSRSGYFSFLFHTSFFSKFSLHSQTTGELRCKISSKCCQSIFKNLASLDKIVEQVVICLKFKEGDLVFTFHRHNGIRRQHNLTFQECEGLSAIFSKESYLVHVVAENKLFGECIQHFAPNVNELTISVTPDFLLLKNFVEEEHLSSEINSQVKLIKGEFNEYDVLKDKNVTFCMKEFKAIIAFHDALNLPLHIYLGSDSPIVMSIEDGLFESDFVLATLIEQDKSHLSQCPKKVPEVNGRLAPEPSQFESSANPFHFSPQAPVQAVTRLATPPLDQPSISNNDNPNPSHDDLDSLLSQTPPLSPTPHHSQTCLDDELIASLQNITDVPHSPPHKRFRRLSSSSSVSEEDPGSHPLKYCEDSD